MKLQQLRYICEVARRGLNVSLAAKNMYTSQPSVSKQILLLEQELDLDIFIRSGRHLTGITPAGEVIVNMGVDILSKIKDIKKLAQEFSDEKKGSLSVATTHTQARYALPSVVRTFREYYPHVSLHIHQGTPAQMAKLVADGAIDCVIATEALELFSNLMMLPCYRWNRVLLLNDNHTSG